MTTYYTIVESPIDPLLLRSDGTHLTGLFMRDHPLAGQHRDGWTRSDDIAPFFEARRQLEAYFAGALTEFSLPLKPQNGKEFQMRVWEELARIPYGVTLSYKQLAERTGSPAAFRAVGQANSRNALCIIVPCHRVIGANGKSTGYSGGLERQQWLLEHEKATLATPAGVASAS